MATQKSSIPKKKSAPKAKATGSQASLKKIPAPSKVTPKSPQKKSTPKKRIPSLTKKIIAGTIAVISIIGILISLMIYQLTEPQQTPQTSLLITPHTSATKIITELKNKGLIPSTTGALIYVRIKGMASQLKAGRFIIPENQTPIQILSILVDPKACLAPVKLTIPEGFDCFKLARRLEKIGIVENEQDTLNYLLKTGKELYVEDFPFLEDAPSLEGYLFPNTYHFSVGTPLENLIKASLVEFTLKVVPVLESKSLQTMPVRLSNHQIITLASIVEREASFLSEMPTIASVYFNRIKKNMKLQADPTVLYALENTSKPRIYYKDLEIESPYNTYYTIGLPPGPIANPGLAAIKAVLNPAKTNYLYFVADPETHRHLFSLTYKEHAQKVIQMHAKRSALGIR